MTKKAKTNPGFYQPRATEASTATLSADGRRLNTTTNFLEYRDAGHMRASSHTVGEPGVQPDTGAALKEGVSVEPVAGMQGVSVAAKARDEPLAAWKPLRAEYLDEVLRSEGRGRCGRSVKCGLCNDGSPEYRCGECLGGRLLCKNCVVVAHSLLPLHRVQVR